MQWFFIVCPLFDGIKSNPSTSGFSFLLVAVPPHVSKNRNGNALLGLSCADVFWFYHAVSLTGRASLPVVE